MHFSHGLEPLIGWAKAGMNFIIHASDLQLVRQHLTADVARMRAALADGSTLDTGVPLASDPFAV